MLASSTDISIFQVKGTSQLACSNNPCLQRCYIKQFNDLRYTTLSNGLPWQSQQKCDENLDKTKQLARNACLRLLCINTIGRKTREEAVKFYLAEL